MEGFDVDRDDEALTRLYTGGLTTVSSLLTSTEAAMVRSGATFDSGGAHGTAILHTPTLVASPENSWIVGFAFRSNDTASINTGAIPYIAWHNDDGEQLRIEFVEDLSATKPGGSYYYLRIMRGATEIASGTDRFQMSFTTPQEWVHFEIKVTIDDSLGSVEGRYSYPGKTTRTPSGPVALSWDASVSSIDTQEQASTGADAFVISFNTGSASDQVAFDDIYVCDSTGSKNNDYLGRSFVTPQRITLTGDGDGDTTEWALATAVSTEDAWQEPATSIEDNDRLTSDTVGQIHLAAYDSLIAMDQSLVIGVQLHIHGRMETTGSLSIGFMWRKTTATAAQVEFGTALVVDSTAVVAAAVVAEDDPNTTTDWVFADLDTYQYGVKNNG
jgi:hypothetical protein